MARQTPRDFQWRGTVSRSVVGFACLMLCAICSATGSDPAHDLSGNYWQQGCALAIKRDGTFEMNNLMECNYPSKALDSDKNSIPMSGWGLFQLKEGWVELKFSPLNLTAQSRVRRNFQPDIRLLMIRCGNDVRLVDPPNFNDFALALASRNPIFLRAYDYSTDNVSTDCDPAPLPDAARAVASAPLITAQVLPPREWKCEQADADYCSSTIVIDAGSAGGVRNRMEWFFADCGHGDYMLETHDIQPNTASLKLESNRRTAISIKPGTRLTNRIPACHIPEILRLNE